MSPATRIARAPRSRIASLLALTVAVSACGRGERDAPLDAGEDPGSAGGGVTAGGAGGAGNGVGGGGAVLDATSTPDAGVVADGSSRTDTDAGAGAGESGAPGTTGDLTREVPGFANRAYLLHPPGGVVPTKPAPVVIVFHGGGGNADGVVRMTCPGGDLASDACIDRLADREGFLLVIPNGTGTLLAPNTRTWNAGGGTANWQCVSGQACMRGIDDVAYFDALMADLATVATIDSRRVFLTGISNGAAMSHRLACERADAVAAIAPVAGGNQLTTGAPCTPSRPVSVLAIHGTADPCWAFDGGPGACLQTDNKDKIGIPRTMEEWAARDGCDATPTTTPLPDVAPDDGVTTTVEDYAGCAGDTAVRLMKIDGGGHTWPNGFQYLAPATIGITTRDFSANEAMWEFLAEHPIP